MNKISPIASLLACLFLAVSACANESGADLRAVIQEKFPGVQIDGVRPSPVAGVYEVVLGADTAYVSADGRYLFSGDLYEIDTRTNVTELSRTQARREVLAKLDERDMIVFEPAGEAKHTVTVFTDVECGYCRRLHSEIGRITQLGVRVRYLAYPRAGPGTDDWRKMEAVWCSLDRRRAITQAKLGQEVKAPDCGATPVASQYALGESVGVRGTPAIFAATGEYIGGYLPPERLLAELDELAKQHK